MTLARTCTFSFLLVLLLCGSLSGEELAADWRSGLHRDIREAYRQYLSAYYVRIREKPERLDTVRPLTEGEYEAVLRSVEFIGMMSHREKNPGDRDSLQGWECELRALAETGRIKYDSDPEEARYATRMTAHIPSDPSDPFEGDIYIHDPATLQGVSLPLEALRKLSAAQVSRETEESKKKTFEGSLWEGLVLLSSSFVHECRHRAQHRLVCEEGEPTPAQQQEYILQIEDPAYTDQYRYLAIVSGVSNDVELKRRVRSLRDTIVGEVNARFPGLREFRAIQKEWR